MSASLPTPLGPTTRNSVPPVAATIALASRCLYARRIERPLSRAKAMPRESTAIDTGCGERQPRSFHPSSEGAALERRRGQMPMRFDHLPICRHAELDLALPLRELPARNVFAVDHLDFRVAAPLFLHQGHPTLFQLLARGEARLLRELWLPPYI